MVRTRIVAFAGLLFLAWSGSLRAQDDECRALVLQAMKAHGGKEALKKFAGAQAKYKGTVEVNGMSLNVEGEITVQNGERMKNVIKLDINNMKIEVQQGFDGKVLWLNVAGNTQEIKDKELIQEMKESMYSEQVANLADLDMKEYKLAALGEMKIKDKDAVGLRVSKEGKRDVNLWFDKKSHLLLKSEFRGKDPFGQMAGEVNQEKYFTEYKDVNGIQVPRRLEVQNDGKRLVDLEIVEATVHERLDDSYFARP